MDTTGKKEKRTSKKNVEGRSTSSHNKKLKTRSTEKQRGMAFGFRKTATAVKKTRIDIILSYEPTKQLALFLRN
jgi:N-acetylmuramoyl-L-alanine amidase CwlA